LKSRAVALNVAKCTDPAVKLVEHDCNVALLGVRFCCVGLVSRSPVVSAWGRDRRRHVSFAFLTFPASTSPFYKVNSCVWARRPRQPSAEPAKLLLRRSTAVSKKPGHERTLLNCVEGTTIDISKGRLEGHGSTNGGFDVSCTLF
jgi:hypothetical protein